MPKFDFKDRKIHYKESFQKWPACPLSSATINQADHFLSTKGGGQFQKLSNYKDCFINKGMLTCYFWDFKVTDALFYDIYIDVYEEFSNM